MRSWRGRREQEWSTIADGGLQQERTALAWERTAISIIVSGILLTRYAAQDAHPFIALAGVAEAAIGGVVLVWAGVHYADLHAPIREDEPVVHPLAARLVGLTTIVFSGFALGLLAVSVLAD